MFAQNVIHTGQETQDKTKLEEEQKNSETNMDYNNKKEFKALFLFF